MTGVALLAVELVPKRLELVLELVPNATGIGALINPKNSNAGRNLTALQDAAREKGVQLHIVEASAEADFEKAFASLASLQAGALVVGADPFFNARRSQIVALAAQHSLPTIYEWREFVDAGGLISYGTSLAGVYRQIGTYVGRILGGEKLRSASPATDHLRAGRQSQDRQGARSDNPAIDPRPRRRSRRVSSRPGVGGMLDDPLRPRPRSAA
jgi:putative tryptophan/tyrosine transport system substrate-binding protein